MLTNNIACATYDLKMKKLLNIKKIRKILGLSQEQLAVKIGVSRCTINRWENSHNNPSKLALREMQRLLNRKVNKEAYD